MEKHTNIIGAHDNRLITKCLIDKKVCSHAWDLRHFSITVISLITCDGILIFFKIIGNPLFGKINQSANGTVVAILWKILQSNKQYIGVGLAMTLVRVNLRMYQPCIF